MASLFCLFLIEMYLHGKTGGHSHGGPTGSNLDSHAAPPRPPRYDNRGSFEADDIKYEKDLARRQYEDNLRNELENPFDNNPELGPQSEMPAWFVVFYEQYVRQRLEMMNMIRSSVPAPRPQQRFSVYRDNSADVDPELADSPYIDPDTGKPVPYETYRKLSLNITLLEGGILFHSVFVGMTVSITIEGFVILLVAILFHQMFEGLGLGSRIAAVPYAKGSIRPWILVVAFGTTAPIGQAIGLLTRNTYDPNSAFGLIIVGVFNAM